MKSRGLRGGRLAALTPQERVVAEKIATGDENSFIAKDLKISLNTVKRHLTAICDKLGFENRTQIAVWWVTHTPEIEGLMVQISSLEAENEKLKRQRGEWRGWAF